MSRSHLLLIDAVINLALGVVLVVIPKALANAVGLPSGPVRLPRGLAVPVSPHHSFRGHHCSWLRSVRLTDRTERNPSDFRLVELPLPAVFRGS